jgi:hypothetical protein
MRVSEDWTWVDSTVDIPLKQPFAPPASTTHLCIAVDTTRYIVNSNDSDPYISVRPRLDTDTSYLRAKLSDRRRADAIPSAIIIRVWAEPERGQHVEIPGTGGQKADGTWWMCFSAEPLDRDMSYRAVRIGASKPFRAGKIIWRIYTR